MGSLKWSRVWLVLLAVDTTCQEAPCRGAVEVPKARAAGGGEMMRKILGVMVGFVVLSLFMALAPTVRADHLYATEKIPPGFAAGPNHIDILTACGGSLSYPANTGFFVARGWFYFPWNGAPTVEKNAFMSSATKFALYIDGQLQTSVMHAFLVNFPDGQGMIKPFVSEDNNGLSGTHMFDGRFFLSDAFFGGNRLDPVLVFTCVVTVNFT